jgi:hypothetical protein
MERKAMVLINKYRNAYLVAQHEGSYALNIKYYAHRHYMSDEDFSEAYDIAKKAFFDQVEFIIAHYGFKGFSVEGKNSGWLKPITETNKTVQTVFDDYLTFEEYLVQDKIYHMFEMIKEQQRGIKNILEYSETLDDFIQNIESYEEI